MVDANIKGVLYGIAAALPLFRAQGHGHVINVSSIAAYRIVPTAAVYCATKAAVNFITEGLRQESRTIRTTIISPGVTESDLGRSVTHADPCIADYVRCVRYSGRAHGASFQVSIFRQPAVLGEPNRLV